jgi:hypothetical protein
LIAVDVSVNFSFCWARAAANEYSLASAKSPCALAWSPKPEKMSETPLPILENVCGPIAMTASF